MKTFQRFGVSVLTVLLSVTVLYAATTIGSNITTAGNLQVDGNATTTGYLTVGTAPAAAVFSAGTLNVQNSVMVGGNASTTGTGLFGDTLTVNKATANGTVGSGIDVTNSVGATAGAGYGMRSTLFGGATTPLYGISSVISTGASQFGVYSNVSGGTTASYAVQGVTSGSSDNYALYGDLTPGAGGNQYVGYFNTNNATTTVAITTTSSSKGSCLQLKDAAGNTVYAYVAPSGTTFTVSTVSCK